MHAAPQTDFIYNIMRGWGCPAHSETFYRAAKELHGYPYDYYAFRRQMNRMAKTGKIRVLRPAVFSAFGPEMD